jgi:hypothetical protein
MLDQSRNQTASRKVSFATVSKQLLGNCKAASLSPPQKQYPSSFRISTAHFRNKSHSFLKRWTEPDHKEYKPPKRNAVSSQDEWDRYQQEAGPKAVMRCLELN